MLPTLYHKDKHGRLRQWRVWAEGDQIKTEHGLVDGAMQVSSKRAKPKNVGRANATTAEEQAESEAASMWQYKRDRKYAESKEDAQEPLMLPMLAHKYTSAKAKKLEWPVDVQPKLDGVRCLARWGANGRIELISRSGKPYSIPHIAVELAKWLRKDMVLDGELYLHGESCQHITSLVKSACLATSKSYKKGSLDLIYHVYDVPSCERIWADRKKCLESIKLFMVDKNVSNVAVVRTREARSESEMQDIHDFYVEEGYEGVIVRARNHEYLWGFRSDGLLKYKCFEDGEFTVIDAKEGVGKMVGHVVWICQNDINDKTFDCTPKVSMDERKRFYQERSSYIGKKLTVRYFGRTDADKPRFPVGIVFRSKKDM